MMGLAGLASGAMGIGGGVAGAMLGSAAAKKQFALMKEALDNQKMVDKRTYGDLAPYRDFGADQLKGLDTFVDDKSASNYIDPGYDFRLNSGTNAINNNAAASGMLQSGDTLRALTEYGQNMGSQEYGNAFNRFLGEGQFRQGLAGMGQNAATQGGQLANQGAANISQTSMNMDAGGHLKPWADFASGMGGLGMQGFGKAGGMNALSNIFKQG
jgi:hypothetical protein